MKISKQTRRDAKQLYRLAMVNGVLDENKVRQIVDEVINSRPRGFMGILSHLQRLIKLDQERRAVRIESFSVLDGSQREELKSGLQKRYGAGLNFEFSENPALLGGVRIKVGSDVYDGTVRARLRQLQESFESA